MIHRATETVIASFPSVTLALAGSARVSSEARNLALWNGDFSPCKNRRVRNDTQNSHFRELAITVEVEATQSHFGALAGICDLRRQAFSRCLPPK
jgi:hypothetical protein